MKFFYFIFAQNEVKCFQIKAQITFHLGFPTEKGYLAYALGFFFKLELLPGTPVGKQAKELACKIKKNKKNTASNAR